MLEQKRSAALISLGQLVQNYRAVLGLTYPKELVAVVKGDAYGHGAVAVAHRLSKEGVRWFAVSSIEEASILRANGIAGRILLISGFVPATLVEIYEHNLTPVLH
jgi:alanine racemase